MAFVFYCLAFHWCSLSIKPKQKREVMGTKAVRRMQMSDSTSLITEQVLEEQGD